MATKTKKIKKHLYWPERLRPAAKIHGGKFYLARKLHPLAPDDYGPFVDLYGGMGSMSFNCPPGHHVTYVEKNVRRFTVMQMLQQRGPELIEQLRLLNYDEATFKKYQHLDETYRKAIVIGAHPDPMDIAVAYIARHRMSRGGLGETFAWSERKRGGQPGDLNAWITNLASMAKLHERCQGWCLVNGRAMEVYRDLSAKFKQDGIGNPLWYLDPTYPEFTRSTKAREYGDDEMTIEDHTVMLRTMAECEDYVMISCYRNDLYDGILKPAGFKTVEFEVPNNSSQAKTKERRIEVIYKNF